MPILLDNTNNGGETIKNEKKERIRIINFKWLHLTILLWVAGSTHIVLLPMNVILDKECEESGLLAQPTESELSVLTGTFFEDL